MPCLNEAKTIGDCVATAMAALADLGVDGEVLVSDNGSTDGSPDIARNAGAHVVRAEQRGYGAALITGIEQARGQYVIMADADSSYDLASIGRFLAELRQGRDLVMGNRFRGGKVYQGNYGYRPYYLIATTHFDMNENTANSDFGYQDQARSLLVNELVAKHTWSVLTLVNVQNACNSRVDTHHLCRHDGKALLVSIDG